MKLSELILKGAPSIIQTRGFTLQAHKVSNVGCAIGAAVVGLRGVQQSDWMLYDAERALADVEGIDKPVTCDCGEKCETAVNYVVHLNDGAHKYNFGQIVIELEKRGL